MVMLYCLFAAVVFHKPFSASSEKFSVPVLALTMLIFCLLAQGFGSNTAFLVILVLGMVAIYLMTLAYQKRLNPKGLFKSSSTAVIMSQSGLRAVIVTAFASLISIVFLVLILIMFFPDIIGLFRIFGYGSIADNDSITSRISLLSNFYTQFSIAPILGNFNSDVLTTGAGTYPHSSLLSVLTEWGVLGCILYLVMIYFHFIGTRLTLCSYNNLRLLKMEKLFRQCCILVLLIYSLLATYFLWGPLFFIIGLFGLPVKFTNGESNA
jgi:hypothetical protein